MCSNGTCFATIKRWNSFYFEQRKKKKRKKKKKNDTPSVCNLRAQNLSTHILICPEVDVNIKFSSHSSLNIVYYTLCQVEQYTTISNKI